MREYEIDGRIYRMPDSLKPFQLDLYKHLIDWKWTHVTKESGYTHYGGREIPCDAIIPEALQFDLPMIYPPVVEVLKAHHRRHAFRLQTFFYHMASSQAANVNLFFPLLHHPRGSEVLSTIRPDFARLATDHLDNGYMVEFWDVGYGVLNDKSASAGTEADLAIAYYDHDDILRIWLIEHNLAETGFTPCGGFESSGRQPHHDCSRSFNEILAKPDFCYLHDHRHRNYWNLTANTNWIFSGGQETSEGCPFRDGRNQLWRNHLLALGVAHDPWQPYLGGHFSVVKHPRNDCLNETIAAYCRIIGNHHTFSVFTSAEIVQAAEATNDPELRSWATWYRELYQV